MLELKERIKKQYDIVSQYKINSDYWLKIVMKYFESSVSENDFKEWLNAYDRYNLAFNKINDLERDLELEELKQQLINSENQRKMLAYELIEYKEANDFNNDLIVALEIKVRDLENKLEEQKELVELGESLKYAAKMGKRIHCWDENHISMLNNHDHPFPLIEWYRQQKEGK